MYKIMTDLQELGDVQDIIAMHFDNLFLTFPVSEINTTNPQVTLHIENLVLTYGYSLVKAEIEFRLSQQKKVG